MEIGRYKPTGGSGISGPSSASIASASASSSRAIWVRVWREYSSLATAASSRHSLPRIWKRSDSAVMLRRIMLESFGSQVTPLLAGRCRLGSRRHHLHQSLRLSGCISASNTHVTLDKFAPSLIARGDLYPTKSWSGPAWICPRAGPFLRRLADLLVVAFVKQLGHVRVGG